MSKTPMNGSFFLGGKEHDDVAFLGLLQRIYSLATRTPTDPVLQWRKKNTWIWRLLKIQPSGYLARFNRTGPAAELKHAEIAAKNIH